MSWGSSIVIAIILAVIGAVAAFAMASLAVDWLRISSREGEAGYFAVFMGLLGIIAGIALGLIVTRYVGGPGLAGFGLGLGAATALLLAVIGLAGGWAWLQNDPWPQFAGQYLAFAVEMRSTRGFALDPATARGDGGPDATMHFWIGAHGAQGDGGRIDFTKSRQESDRWIVPGTVRLVTGRRDLYFGMQENNGKIAWINITAPRPLDPAKSDWSEWKTAQADVANGGVASPDGMALRYRLIFAPE